MADKNKAVPARDKGRQWIGWVITGALLAGVVAAGSWFGLAQPRFWQRSAPMPAASPVEAVLPTPTAQAIVSPLSPPVDLNPDIGLAPPAPRNTTFTSRELVTTTLAVPLANWAHGSAQNIALSADGRHVAFTAKRSSGNDDLYLYDRIEETLTHVTVAPDGASSNGWVGAAAMTPDGRYLAFYAWASNLVAGDTNAVQDLFFYDHFVDDHAESTISRISVGANGRQANDRSGDSSPDTAPTLSADGRYVAFHSAASNLTRGDSNGRMDVFLYDRTTQETTLVSAGQNGTGGNGDSSHPAMSVDARFVAFQSRATNLDPTVPMVEGQGISQIYLHDREENSTRLISRGVDGRPGDGESAAPAISGDGRYLVYASRAANLVAGDTNHASDIFLYDRVHGTTQRVSVSSAGIQANRDATLPQITLDGRHIVFSAAASNLTNGDGNGVADLFLYDQAARHTSRVSVAVRGAWTGAEANGPTASKAAIIPGGRLVGFVSQATNLVAAEAAGVPGLYLHERIDAPTYVLAGQVVESSGQPVAGVVVAAGPHRTTTDDDGHFRFPTLVGGTYTLAAAKVGYTFSPPRRTVSLLRDLGEQNFLAVAGSDPTTFLDLPLPYDQSAATLLALLRDSDEGGWIDAWFDHDAPDYGKNGSILLWDGRRRDQNLYDPTLGCFERRCYDGHDGIDFPYRDPDPSTPNIFEPIWVRPAAPGLVAAAVRACDEGDRGCNLGYGNEVVLWHENGYFTRYSHLATVLVEASAWQTPDSALGEMGSTGNSFGTHLHFAVHLDNGNGQWDGETIDLPVDPFGWAGVDVDPWAVGTAATVSRWLWRFNPTTEAILLGSEGATLRDGAGNVTVRIPAGALAGQMRVELVTGAAVAPPASAQRTLGHGFRLQVLDWLQGGSAPNAAPVRPVEISVGFADAALRHLDTAQMLLYHWQPGSGWSPLPTVVDQQAQVAIAASNQLGDFDLQAPLLCPADALEPDDSFDAATVAARANPSWVRLFDVGDDEDWFQIEAAAGASYTVEVEATAPGVKLTVELYDHDGLTRLDQRTGPGAITWRAATAGSTFIRVAPAAGSLVGCDASYRISLTSQE